MNNAITYCKAIGIILMVLGHCECSVPFVRQTLYMFHMPLFFFLSGYCLKEKYFQNPQIFLLRRIKTIWWPYVKWSLFFLSLHVIYTCFVSDDIIISYSWKDVLYRIIRISLTMSGHEQLLAGFWFMRALFGGSILAFIFLYIIKLFNSSNKQNSIIICFFLIIILFSLDSLSNYYSFVAPLTQIIFASIFYTFGYFFSVFNIHRYIFKIRLICWLLVFIGSFFWFIEMVDCPYNNMIVIPFLITGIMGTWCLYSLSWNKLSTKTSSLLGFIGNHTMIILSLHFLFFKIVSFIIVRYYHLPFDRLYEFPVIAEYAHNGWWIAYWIIGLLFPLIFVKISLVFHK